MAERQNKAGEAFFEIAAYVNPFFLFFFTFDTSFTNHSTILVHTIWATSEERKQGIKEQS